MKTLTALTLLALLLPAANDALAQSGLTVGTNLVDISQLRGNETDPSIAISPLNASNMFVVSATDGVVPGLFCAWTTNMGVTWTTNILATNNNAGGLVPAYGEPSAAWDTFGNLFVAYLPAAFEGVAVMLSTNGGVTFAAVTNLAPLDATDQPRISAPPAGAAAGTVWAVFKDYTLANTPLVVQGEQSSGLGTNGTFTPEQIIPDSVAGGFPDIAAGPAGQVMVTFQDNLYTATPANIFISVNSNAVTSNGFAFNFAAPLLVASDAIGGSTYRPVEETGIGLNAAPGLGWDSDSSSSYYGNAYLVYTALGSQSNLIINSCISTNGGATWSLENQVNDDTNANDHFFPRLAVDPATGIIGYSWFDCRNDQGGSSAPVVEHNSANFTFADFMITNVIFTLTNGITNNNTITTSYTDLTGGGSNIVLTVSGDNFYGVLLASNSADDIYIYSATNTNVLITLQGAETNFNANVNITVNDYIPNAFSFGTANSSASVYTTLSTNGAASFLPNQPLIPASYPINPPSVSFSSYLPGSDSLTGWGHYTALAGANANFFPVWPDNSDVIGNNPDGATSNFDLYIIGGATGVSLPTADVSVFVTNSPNPVISEGVLVYTLVVSNNGPEPSGPIVLTDVLPANVTLEAVVPAVGVSYANFHTYLVFNVPSLAIHKALTNTIRVTATRSDFATNFASAYGPLIDLVSTNNTNQLVLLIDGENLALGMTTSETNALIGDTVTNWIVVTNLGPSTNGPALITNIFSPNWGGISVQTPGTYFLTNEVVASGTNYLTNSEAVIDLGLLPVGAAVTSIVTAVTLSDGSYATNSAFVSSQDVDTNLNNNSSTLVTFINGEDLAIGLFSPSNIDLGEPLVYTITVTNFGPSYSGDVMVSDVLSGDLAQIAISQPQGTYVLTNTVTGGVTNPLVVLDLGPLASGQSATMTISAVATGNSLRVTNTATVSSTDFDTNLANNTAGDVVSINGEDLAIGIISPPGVVLGSYANYLVAVTNLGLSTNGQITGTITLTTNLGQFVITQSRGTNAIIGDQVLFNLGTLAASEVATMSISALALSAPDSAVVIASVTSSDFDTNLDNNVAVSTIPVYGENLALSLSASPTNLQVGQVVTYTTWVTNLGPATNAVVLVTNTLSSRYGQITVLQPASNYTNNGNVFVFQLGLMAPGQIVPITLDATALSAGSATTTAGVGSSNFDTNLLNNTAKSVLSIIAAQPMISNVVVKALASSAFINFNTGAAANVQVQYGLTSSYGSVSSATSPPSSNHIVLLTGLERDTNYSYNILAWVGTKLYTTNGAFATVDTLILPTSDADYAGIWSAGYTGSGIYGNYYQIANTTNVYPTASAAYIPNIPVPGQYDVSIWHPQNPEFTTNAQVYISGATNEVIVSVNQTTNGGGWQPLVNDMYFAGGVAGNATIYNDTGETNKSVVANAMRWVYDPAQDYPTNGSVPAWWATYFFGTNTAAASGASDPDGDGYSNYADYVFGTNPTNTASTLNFSLSRSGATVTVVFFPWQGGRAYQLLAASDLAAGVWTPLTNTVTVTTNGDGVFTLTQPGAASAFYRLSATVLPQ